MVKIESEHPPLRLIKLPIGDETIDAYPYKKPQDSDTQNLKNIVVHNNFINAHLQSIGKQLSRIEGQPYPSVEPSETTDKRLKNPMFKPYQISSSAQQEIKKQKSNFLDAVREQFSRLGPSSSTYNLVVPDTPQSLNQNVSILDKVSCSQSEDSEFQEQFPEIAKLHWSNSQPFRSGYTKAKYPELKIGTHSDILVQPNFSANSIYEWNIDGMMEYQILNSLQ